MTQKERIEKLEAEVAELKAAIARILARPDPLRPIDHLQVLSLILPLDCRGLSCNQMWNDGCNSVTISEMNDAAL